MESQLIPVLGTTRSTGLCVLGRAIGPRPTPTCTPSTGFGSPHGAPPRPVPPLGLRTRTKRTARGPAEGCFLAACLVSDAGVPGRSGRARVIPGAPSQHQVPRPGPGWASLSSERGPLGGRPGVKTSEPSSRPNLSPCSLPPLSQPQAPGLRGALAQGSGCLRPPAEAGYF